jgi:hypothetical protein
MRLHVGDVTVPAFYLNSNITGEGYVLPVVERVSKNCQPFDLLKLERAFLPTHPRLKTSSYRLAGRVLLKQRSPDVLK